MFVKEALEKGDLEAVCNNLTNDFEQVVDYSDVLAKIKEKLIQQGAKNALMSGSGSCIFGIFANKEQSKKAYINLRQEYQTFYAISMNNKEG